MTASQPRVRRRTFAGVATLGLGLPVLAACSGGGANGTTATDPNTPSSSPTRSPTGTPGETSGEPTKSASEPADAFAQTSDIAEGGGTIFPDEQIVITQPSKGEFRCFTAVCTHQGCIVSSVSEGSIHCICHGSAFSITDGSVVNGPATQPLAEEQITVQGDAITLG